MDLRSVGYICCTVHEVIQQMLINSSSFVSEHHILFSTVSNMIITVESMLRLSDRYN